MSSCHSTPADTIHVHNVRRFYWQAHGNILHFARPVTLHSAQNSSVLFKLDAKVACTAGNAGMITPGMCRIQQDMLTGMGIHVMHAHGELPSNSRVEVQFNPC